MTFDKINYIFFVYARGRIIIFRKSKRKFSLVLFKNLDFFGSGALNGKSLVDIFSYLYSLLGALTLQGPILIPLLTFTNLT